MSRLTRRGAVAGGRYPTLSASLSPASLSGTGTGSTVSVSGSATIDASGGSGSFTYAWERVSGSTGISAVAPTSAATGFTATGLTADETRSAVWRGQVTDAVTGNVAYTATNVSLSITRSAAAISASLTPSSLSGAGTGATVSTSGSVTASGSGGTGSYSYAWERVSGSAVPTATAGSSASTGFTTSSIAAGATQSAVWRCLVTDTGSGQTAYTGNVSFSLTRNYATLSVSASPSSLSGSGNGATVVTSGSATASVSGGSGSWTGAWEWDGGAATGSIVPTSPGSTSTAFQSGDAQAQGTTRDAGFRFRATDSVTGSVATSASVAVNLTRYAALSATAAPSSLSGSGPNTPVVTSGSATCTVSGGSGSRTYLWEWDGGASSGSIVASSPPSATTAFQSGDAQAPGTTRGQGMRCRVTDTVTGDVVVSSSVGVNLTRTATSISYANVSPGSQAWPPETPSEVGVLVAHDGAGPFTYAWSASPSLGTTFGSPSSSNTSVSRANNTVSVTVTCRVTDNGAGGVFVDAVGTITGGGA